MSRVAEWLGTGWTVKAEDSVVHVDSGQQVHRFSARDQASLRVRRVFLGLGPAYLSHSGLSLRVRLRGLSRRDGRALKHRLEALDLFALIEWGDRLDALIAEGLEDQLWIARDRRDEVKQAKPQVRVSRTNRRAFPEEADRAEDLLHLDVDALVAATNEDIVTLELASRKGFLDTIEKQPLSGEQSRAVVEYDNRVQVVAAAGSGKTTVMVARAAYAIDKGVTASDRVLLLAFNRAAAKELQDRVDARFKAAGIPSDGVRASTFHSLGLTAIGAATGFKPRVAPWITDSGGDAKKTSQIVDLLRDESTDYRDKWDLYRLIFARTPIDGPSAGTPDGYDPDLKVTGYETLDDKVVKSFGEKTVADWLFINGVTYNYEEPYPISTATSDYRQYHPDFYYPEIDTWHEHWAIGPNGKPPAEFVGYAEGMNWKRDLHRRHGTDLIETTWHEIVNEERFDHLEAELVSRGVELDWNPNRVTDPRKAMTDRDLERLMRTFMTHVKSNSLSRADLEARLAGPQSRLAGARTRLFLDLYWPIHDAWNADLDAENYVDFEDMLVKAADHLERGDVDLGYDLVLADEFQDASQARVRLVMGLVNKPHRHLLAVGDDWQSINRFAGADISAMTDFDSWFGPASQLEMTRTFRFPQKLADISSNFVMENPRQIRKKVSAAGATAASHAKAVEVVYEEPFTDVVAETLEKMSQHAKSDSTTRSVFILGRYRSDRDLVPKDIPTNLDVTFSTVHGSKGLEADYVIVPNMGVGTYGFPSGVEDDPILNLAMTEPDTYLDAEERRLFYVALTRARLSVTLITRADRPSPFVVELVRKVPDLDPASTIHPCKVCGQGTMVQRQGTFGVFYGCSAFPACTALSKTPDGQPTTKTTSPDAKTARRCAECGKGTMVKRNGDYGPFYGCSQYPHCKATAPLDQKSAKPTRRNAKATWATCPRCGGRLGYKTGKFGRFQGCSNYPRCQYTRNT